MNTTRPCGCKGRRTCLYCETSFNIPSTGDETKHSDLDKLIYCPFCNLCYQGEDASTYKRHPNHTGDPLKYEGIYVQMDFLTDEEHNRLMDGIDSMSWNLSQSGRRKQNFGPKCNFKGRRLRLGDFEGFPSFSKFVQDKFTKVPILDGFQTIEQCSLEYDPKRGSSIDPHVDDCWVWGERVVTVNLLSDSVLTLMPNRHPGRYNLDLVRTYPKVVDVKDDRLIEYVQKAIVKVSMPKNSLLVMYGRARYDYEHCILREDIVQRRVCLAYREFTPIFLEDGPFYKEGKMVVDKAKVFIQVDSVQRKASTNA